MLSLYSGTPGGGKSYHATHLGLEWVRKGKYVIANFPIKMPEKFIFKFERKIWENMLERWLFVEEITVAYLISKSFEMGWFGHESKCLILIDEAGVIFNARDWQVLAAERTKWIKFMSQHRKMGYDIVMVAQFDRMIDRQMRGCIEYEVRHLKANNSFFLSFLSLFKITLFLYVYKWYQTKLKGSMRFAVYRPSIGKRYDTFRTFNLEELLVDLERYYSGSIIPAAVAVQIETWREELDKKREEKIREQKAQEKQRMREEKTG